MIKNNFSEVKNKLNTSTKFVSLSLLMVFTLFGACSNLHRDTMAHPDSTPEMILLEGFTQVKPTHSITPIATETVSPDEIHPCFMKPINFENIAASLQEISPKLSFPEKKAAKWTWRDAFGKQFTLEKKGIQDNKAIIKFYSILEEPFYFTVSKYAFLVIPLALSESEGKIIQLLYFPFEHQFVDFICPKLPNRFELGKPNAAFFIEIDNLGDFHYSMNSAKSANPLWCYGPLRDYYLLNGELINWENECPTLEMIE